MAKKMNKSSRAERYSDVSARLERKSAEKQMSRVRKAHNKKNARRWDY